MPLLKLFVMPACRRNTIHMKKIDLSHQVESQEVQHSQRKIVPHLEYTAIELKSKVEIFPCTAISHLRYTLQGLWKMVAFT